MDRSNFVDFGKIYEEAMKTRGRVNIIVAGRTGVGKSTLINAVFGEKFCETGQGRPVTKETREIYKKGVPVRIFDTRGLEQKDYEETRAALEQEVKRRGSLGDATEHIHVAWLCISEDSSRVEESERDLCRLLDGLGVPPIGVITKARQDNGFKAKVADLLPETRNVVRVRALPETFDDGHTIPVLGVDDLVAVTYEVVPEGLHAAFAAAQKVTWSLKKSAARKRVAVATAAAVAAGASPIPFSDAAILIPIQVGMLAGITLAYGLSMEEGFLSTLVSSAVGTVGGAMLGRAVAANLIKLVPGAGSLVGGAISAGTAGALTTAIGLAYIAAIEAIFKAGGDFSPENVAAHFTAQIKQQKGI